MNAISATEMFFNQATTTSFGKNMSGIVLEFLLPKKEHVLLLHTRIMNEMKEFFQQHPPFSCISPALLNVRNEINKIKVRSNVSKMIEDLSVSIKLQKLEERQNLPISQKKMIFSEPFL